MAGLGPLSERYGRLLESLAVTSIGPGKVFVVSDGSTFPNLREYQRQFGGKEIVRADLAQAAAAYKAGRGDTILVMPGTYTLSTGVTFSKSNLTLKGLDPARTIIQSSNAAAIDTLLVSGDTCVVEGLTIICDAQSNTDACLRVTGEDTTVRNCRFEDGDTDGNYGIQVQADGLRIENCQFSSTVGVLVDAPATSVTGLLIKDCDFLNCATDAIQSPSEATNGVSLDVISCRFLGTTTPVQLIDSGGNTIAGTIAGCTVDFSAAATGGEARWGNIASTTVTATVGTLGLQDGVPV